MSCGFSDFFCFFSPHSVSSIKHPALTPRFIDGFSDISVGTLFKLATKSYLLIIEHTLKLHAQ